MKKRKQFRIPALLLALLLCTLSACGSASGQVPDEPPSEQPRVNAEESLYSAAESLDAAATSGAAKTPDSGSATADIPETHSDHTKPPVMEVESVTTTCRIVDGADTGNLLLAAQDDSADVYRLKVREDLLYYENPETTELKNGMLVEICHSGMILESYPAQFADIYSILVPDSGMDNLCELYLQVLDDLWEVDPELNSHITELGVDLSSTRLPASEQAAVVLAFGDRHSLFPIQGTYEELVEAGYINGEQLYWENGCLFSISEQNLHSMMQKAGGDSDSSSVSFNAQKWCSGTGAYLFTDCTAERSARGTWDSYEVGGYAIS